MGCATNGLVIENRAVLVSQKLAIKPLLREIWENGVRTLYMGLSKWLSLSVTGFPNPVFHMLTNM